MTPGASGQASDAVIEAEETPEINVAIDADLDQIAYELTVLAEQAGCVLTPDARPPRAARAWA